MIKASPALQSWLDYPVSITDRLKTKVSEVHLQVLSHAWINEAQDEWDKNILNSNLLEPYLKREIIMRAANEHACWYARTLIPQKTYQANHALFERLQTESLGSIIWENTAIKRQQMSQFSIEVQPDECQILCQLRAVDKCPNTPACRSLFTASLDPADEPLDVGLRQTLWGRLSTFTAAPTSRGYHTSHAIPTFRGSSAESMDKPQGISFEMKSQQTLIHSDFYFYLLEIFLPDLERYYA